MHLDAKHKYNMHKVIGVHETIKKMMENKKEEGPWLSYEELPWLEVRPNSKHCTID